MLLYERSQLGGAVIITEIHHNENSHWHSNSNAPELRVPEWTVFLPSMASPSSEASGGHHHCYNGQHHVLEELGGYQFHHGALAVRVPWLLPAW